MAETITTMSNCGYEPDGNPIAPEYLIRIISYRNRKAVTAILQQDLSIRVESKWEPLLPSSVLATANKAAQALTGGRVSIITASTSRRIWQGSSPIQLSINLKFEAIRKAHKEVVEPCQLLQAIALPSNNASYTEASEMELTKSKYAAVKEGIGGVFLAPPGPTPFDSKGLLSRDTNRNASDVVYGLKGGDIIKIEIGQFLSFWNVIVKEATVQYANKFTKEGFPISAIANIVFESYEMMTVETLDDSYNMKKYPNISEKEKYFGGELK